MGLTPLSPGEVYVSIAECAASRVYCAKGIESNYITPRVKGLPLPVRGSESQRFKNRICYRRNPFKVERPAAECAAPRLYCAKTI